MKLMLFVLTVVLSGNLVAQGNNKGIGLKCGLSFSNAYREHLKNLREGSYTIKPAEDFETQKLSLVKSIFVDLPAYLTEGRRLEEIELLEIKSAYEKLEFKLDSQKGIKDARQGLLESLLKSQDMEAIDYAKVHFEDAIWAYNGRWLTPHIKKQIIEKLWEQLELVNGVDQTVKPLISFREIFEQGFIDKADLNTNMYVELNQMFRHYGFLPRFEF